VNSHIAVGALGENGKHGPPEVGPSVRNLEHGPGHFPGRGWVTLHQQMWFNNVKCPAFLQILVGLTVCNCFLDDVVREKRDRLKNMHLCNGPVKRSVHPAHIQLDYVFLLEKVQDLDLISLFVPAELHSFTASTISVSCYFDENVRRKNTHISFLPPARIV
jgi:hypothetical protein